MPKVPNYGLPRVDTAPLPAVRSEAVDNPTAEGATIGEAISQGGQALSTIAGGLLEKHAAEARDYADQVAFEAADSQLGDWENARVYDPQTGVLNTVKGKDAVNLANTVGQEFDQQASQIASTLTTDRQRIAFARASAERRTTLVRKLDDYGSQQNTAYDTQETNGALQTSQTAAMYNATDPARVSAELGRTTAIVQAYAQRNGLGPEAAQAMLSDALTKIHTGVIDQLLTQGQDQAASAYFDATKDQIAGPALPGVEKALAVGATRGEAQRIVDGIFQAGGTPEDQQAKIRSITDIGLRDEAQKRYDEELRRREATQAASDKNLLDQAYHIVDQTKSVNSIPPAIWSNLKGQDLSQLREYAKRLQEGPAAIKTDPATYLRLMRLAGDDPNAFVNLDLNKYRTTLSISDLEEMAGRQLSMKKGEDKPDKPLEEFQTKDELIKSTLRQYGIDANDPKNDQAVGELSRMLNRRLEVASAPDASGKRRPVTNSEIQQALDSILSEQTPGDPGSWWGFLPGRRFFASKPKSLIQTTIDDIPAATVNTIRQRLQARHLPASDQNVVDVYVESQVK